MFTDGPVTPARLECLINLLRENSRREWSRADLATLLQPKGLPDLTPTSEQANDAITAAIELGLVTQQGRQIKLLPHKAQLSTRELVLNYLDKRVLGATDIEPYYAPFYSYLISLNQKGGEEKDRVAWANEFNQECSHIAGIQNPFNQAKHTGLERWYVYSGHGWFDPKHVFQPNPYWRLLRQLPHVFGKDTRLSGDQFMTRVAEYCPELDSGSIFRRTCLKHKPDARVATLALSHALIDLHLDERIRLHCAPDSRGWSIEAALPPNDGRTLRSARIDYVEICN